MHEEPAALLARIARPQRDEPSSLLPRPAAYFDPLRFPHLGPARPRRPAQLRKFDVEPFQSHYIQSSSMTNRTAKNQVLFNRGGAEEERIKSAAVFRLPTVHRSLSTVHQFRASTDKRRRRPIPIN